MNIMALQEFVGYMDELREIGRAGSTLQNEDDSNKKDAAIKYIETKGLEVIKDTMGPDFDPAKLSPEQRKGYANEGIKLRQQILMDQVGNTLSGSNLESMLNEVKPENLERLAFAKGIEKGEVKGYEELIGRYGAYLAAKDLEERYGAGKVDPKELENIRASVADEVAKEVVDKNKGKFSQATLDAMAQVARTVVQTRGIEKKDYFDKGMKRHVAEQEREFKEYENKSGKKIINYVKASIKALRDDPDTEDSVLAREFIYDAAKK